MQFEGQHFKILADGNGHSIGHTHAERFRTELIT